MRAPNPGPLTLAGTNTWIVGRDPVTVVDPGPALAEHLDAVAAAVAARGGQAEIRATHDHADHADAARPLADRLAARIVPNDLRRDADWEVVPLPGHAPDHHVFVWRERVAFTGDAVLGEGSVFVSSDMAAYLEGLRRLRRRDLEVLCPGHGPPVWDAAGTLDAYVAHRLDRERRLVEALGRGLRSQEQLLDAVWDDVPAALRPFAAMTLRAHLAKLGAEGRSRGLSGY